MYMERNFKLWGALLVLLATIGLSSCLDEHGFSTDPSHRLTFSTDTVAFDTLFTEVSSATHVFLVYNPGKADLRIAHTALAGGESSP